MLSIKIGFWIGRNNITSEGSWIWINGERASSSELIRQSREPNDIGGNKDCITVDGISSLSTVGLAWYGPCTTLL